MTSVWENDGQRFPCEVDPTIVHHWARMVVQWGPSQGISIHKTWHGLSKHVWQQEILIIAIHIFFIGHKMGLSPVSVKAQTQRHGFPTSASQVAGQVNLCLQQSSMGFLRYAF